MLLLLLFFFSYKNIRNGTLTGRIYVSCMRGQCFSSSIHPGKMYRETHIFASFCSCYGSISTIRSSGSFITTQGAEHIIIQSSMFYTFLEAETLPTFTTPQSRLSMNAWGFKALEHFPPHHINISYDLDLGTGWDWLGKMSRESQDLSGKWEEGKSVGAKKVTLELFFFLPQTSSIVRTYPSFSKQEL